MISTLYTIIIPGKYGKNGPLVDLEPKKMGDFIEPGTHRSTNIKVKIETL